MVTINNDVINEIVIKNSRFICFLYNIEEMSDITDNLDYLKGKFKDATHICYAYRFNGKEKYTDDGEPGGTAGAPIMEVLKKNKITNCLAVVVRYFGGTKLGAGGLIRAYSKAVTETLKLTSLNEYILYNHYELEASYDELKLLNTLCIGLDVIRKAFNQNVIYEVRARVDKDNINSIFSSTDIKIKKLNK